MANKYTTLSALFSAIAQAIREKNGVNAKITADNFPSEIAALAQGGVTPTGTVTITENGLHDVAGKAYAQVEVPVGENDDLESLAGQTLVSSGEVKYVTSQYGSSFTVSGDSRLEGKLAVGDKITVNVASDAFGDAEQSHVVNGKYFTSRMV